MKTPQYLRSGNIILSPNEQGSREFFGKKWSLVEHFKSISAAKRRSRELQAGQMGSGILRVIR
jgi:hypothetical protein